MNLTRPPGAPRLREDLVDLLMQRYDSLCRTATLITGDRAAAEDAVADAAVSIWRSQSNEPVQDAPAFLVRCVTNAALKELRTRRRHPATPSSTLHSPGLLEGTSAPDHQAERVDTRITLVQALLCLPPRQRAVIVLTYLCDLSHADVAKTLGCSTGTVKSQAAKALKHLRATLGEIR